MIAIDIETVPDEEKLESKQWKAFKEKNKIEDDQAAALHPAFSKVACICAYDMTGKRTFAECVENETEILLNFSFFLVGENSIFGGHNIKGFDIPFLANRFIANNLNLPNEFRVANRKPWEIVHVDTVELLKFGSGRYLSLDDICLMYGIASPKDGEINALGVWDAYKKGDFESIKKYCGKDVNAWINVYKKIVKLGVINAV
jgi:predicted PolB exonuclease-like 3'-5' exonuclease